MKRRSKKRWKWVLIPALTAVLVLSLAGLALAAGAGGRTNGAPGATNPGAAGAALLPLTQAEEDQLLFLLEEEKLAGDVYESLFEKWGASAFSNIAVSEQRHMERVLTLVERYGLDAPSTLDARGVFVDEALTSLYAALVTQGNASLQAAYQVGVDIEELDIEDLQILIAETGHNDILRVADNLLRASQNHLEAFSSLLED